ncbi:IclR family transcriptional regulator [Mesorhizobium sp.]|uniref:IclR family transcriptional regulator n=1 Tax=Mesorhizobium sp. TaxID=1871066 RepID=UPI000FE8709E|nr:IclR family transcriptional regulator [Mesorhizobium sp.]RWI88952.1 MAG: IclR family transcriptional regulator [Mesorhizobium sp.]
MADRERFKTHIEIPGLKAGAEVPRRSSRAELHSDGTHWTLDARLEDSPSKPSPGIVPALENAIAIISYLNKKAPRGASLTELATKLSISKSHCHSLLKTLTYFDWLEVDADSKVYKLETGLLSDASSLLNSPILDKVRPLLAALVERIKIPCVLSAPLSDDTFVVLDKFNAEHVMDVNFPIGHRFPRNAFAQMRAYLAWQSEERIDLWMASWEPVQYTDRTVLDAESVRAEIIATRRRGYARSIGEFTEGLAALALPIFDRDGKVAFIFNCSSLISTLEPQEKEVAKEMILTANQIHRGIIGRPPEDFPYAT